MPNRFLFITPIFNGAPHGTKRAYCGAALTPIWRDNVKKRLAGLLACAVLLCGCSAGISVENLLTPPKLNAEQTAIYQALTNSVGGGVKLRYPKSGDYRSAFILKNIDDEPGDEALVFYESQSVQSGESSLRLKLLDKDDGGVWTAVYDIACVGSDVDSISFATLGSSEDIDIIVRYSMFNQAEKAFGVLNYVDGALVELYSSSYACLEVIDLNGDGLDELLSVTTDRANQTSAASLFTNGESGFEKLSETALGGGAVDYVSVTKGRLDEKTTAVFLDYSRGSGQYGTDVVYCYGSRVINPDTAGVSSPSTLISRFTNDFMGEIYSTDIDGDGFIEIPATTALPGYETLTRPEQLCAVTWYTIRDDNAVQEYYTYYSSKYRFALVFPNRWQGFVTAVVNSADNEIVFLSYTADTGLEINAATELMRIRAVDKDDADGIAAAKGMTLLGESEDTLYCCTETAGYKTSALALTESELHNCFIVL